MNDKERLIYYAWQDLEQAVHERNIGRCFKFIRWLADKNNQVEQQKIINF